MNHLKLGCAAIVASVIVSAASAVDLSVSSITVVQSVQYGSTPMVGGRTAMVRARIAVTGSATAVSGVDAVLRVSVDGVQQAGSPACSLNGPLAAPVSPSLANLDDTINFWVMVPVSGDVDFRVEVDPAKTVSESNEANNVGELLNQAFVCRDEVDIAYVPIDYTPGGGLPEAYFMEPGMGDNFVRAIYAPGLLNYHRSPTPPLVWTYDVNDTDIALLNALVDIRVNQIPALGHPTPEFIYGWLPGNPYWGNGKSNGIPGDAAFGNTDPSRFQRTFAHELGHLVGLVHNSNTIGTNGIDVEHHLVATENLPQVFPSSKKDVMVAGQLTNAAFVNSSSFLTFLNDARVACTSDGGDGAGGLAPPDDEVVTMLRVCGGRKHAEGTAWLDPVFHLPQGVPTPDDPTGDVAVVGRDSTGTPRWIVRVDTQRTRSLCGGGSGLAERSPIYAIIPAVIEGVAITSVELFDFASAQVLCSRSRSANAPSASIVSVESVGPQPAGGAADGFAPLTGIIRVAWISQDPDGDALSHHVLYSRDEGDSWLPLAVNVVADFVEFDAANVPSSVGATSRFAVRVSDGFESVDSPVFLAAAMGVGNPPDVHLITPNEGDMFPQHADVILHASAWDIEDLLLDDSAIVWTSDTDGVVGHGRLLLLDGLSCGPHALTVTGTDADGMSSSRQVAITVTPRTVLGADLNFDGHVNGADIGLLLGSWGGVHDDLDGNGVVDGGDVGVLLSAWSG